MKTTPLITVILPAYNCERHIKTAMQSMLDQTCRNFELLVVNDGSTDGTLDIVEQLATGDDRIRVFTTPNRGVVAALNLGIDKARGYYIARMDSDDVAMLDRLEVQLALLERDPALVVCGGDVIKFGAVRGPLRYPRSNVNCKASLLFGSCFAHPTVMMRADIFHHTGLRYEDGFECAEDYRLWSRLAAYGDFGNVARPLIEYRIHATQVGTARRAQQRASHLAVALQNWKNAGVEMDADTLQQFLWPRLESVVDLCRYLGLYLRVLALTVSLRPRRGVDYLRFASRAFAVNAGRRILCGRSAHA